MFVARAILAIGVSIVALLISLTLDRLFAPLPAALQFVVQIPLLVIIVDEFRRVILKHGARFGLTEADINGTFFFAAPLAALGASSLLRDLRRSVL